MQHIGRSICSAAHLAPLPGEALLIGLQSGDLAFASGPDLCHLVLTFQGLRWIKALLDPFHGVVLDITDFGNLFGNESFECREGGRRPVAFMNRIRCRKFDTCVLPSRLSSVGSPSTHMYE